MSLSLYERENLLTILQRDFPLANRWEQIKSNNKEFRVKHWVEFLVFPVLATATAGAFWLMVFLLDFINIWATFGAMVLALGALTGAVLSFVGVNHNCSSIKNMFKRKKLKKTNHHKSWMRDYVAKVAAKRKVEQLLPVLNDEELALLFNLPHLNGTFKPFFEKELNKRQQVKSTQNITDEFLGSVKVNMVAFNTTPTVAPAKTLIV